VTAVIRTGTVLVVDDDEPYRVTLVRRLTRAGYHCLEAGDGVEARRILGSDAAVSAAVCDIELPGGSGIDLLRGLAADFPDVAVIMATGVGDLAVAELAVEIGAYGYLVKPFAFDELLIGLATALKRRELEIAGRDHARNLEAALARTRRLASLVSGIGPEARADGDDEETIERLARTVSLRDDETGRHLRRMSLYAALLAEVAGCAGLTIDEVRLATVLHDVGKIGIPDGILLKPGPLTGAERSSMQRHSQIGFQLLHGSGSALVRMAASIALTHHECWDGSGYPCGLAGEEISEVARIAALADVFDALSSKRVYRPALPVDEVVAMMTELRGRQFEPRLLDAFFSCQDELAAIRAAHPDSAEDARIRLLMVDDQEIFLESMVRLLETDPRVKVVGAATTIAGAVAAVVGVDPDVVLMDFELPDGNGALATAQIKSVCPAAKVIMLTGRSDDGAMVQALAAGVSAFLTKHHPVEELLASIEAVHAGDTASPAAEMVPLLRRLRPTNRGLGADLSRRETQVLRLLAIGWAAPEIGSHLGVSGDTVARDVHSLLEKLQVSSKLEAVATAVQEGLIEPPSPTPAH
jgi:putative two-component system response regulator